MNISFHQEHIQDWADVADDYNPIHFDDAAARRLGLNGIVVHGMLPLLHIKHQLTADLAGTTQQEWVTFSSKFRQPVAKDLSHQLEIRARPGLAGRRFALRRHGDGLETIAGTTTSAPLIKIVNPPVVSFEIGKDIVVEKLVTFKRAFPNFNEAWLFLDSVVFSQFLNNNVPFELAQSTGVFSTAADQKELMQRALTVQTSHTVSVHPDLLGQATADIDTTKTIRCDLMPALITSSAANTLVGACQLNVYLDGLFVMQSEVGIYLRFDHISISQESTS